MTPGEFCILYFQELDRLGIAYVILHSREALAKELRSDVDYAVPTRELGKLAGIQSRLAERVGWRLAQAIEPHTYSLFTVVIDPTDAEVFVQLDACGHYVERGCFLLPDRALLEDRVKEGGFFAPAPAAEFAYLLAKALAKGGAVARRLPRLRELWQRAPQNCEASLRRLVGPLEGGLEAWFQRPPADWEDLRARLTRQNRFGLADRLRELARGWRRLLEPEGLCLAWVDAAGQGGSILKELVGRRIQGPFFRKRQAVSLGTGLATYWSRVFPAKVRNELVIAEGGANDQPLDLRRYGIGKAGGFGRWLRRLAPRADLTLLIVSDQEAIPARQPEIPREEPRRQRVRLEELPCGQKGYAVVFRGPSPEATAKAACREVIEFLAERERRRGC